MAIDYTFIFSFIQAFLIFLKELNMLIFTEVTVNSLGAYILLSLGGSAVNGLDYFRDGLTRNEVILIITGAIISVFLAVIFYAEGTIDGFYMSIIGFIAPFVWVRLVKIISNFFSADSGETGKQQEGAAASIPSEANPIIDPSPPTIEVIPNPADKLLEKALEEAKAEA